MKKILISHSGDSTCAAVVIDGELDAVYFEQIDTPRLVGNIYKGRVQNFLPSMSAAEARRTHEKNYNQSQRRLNLRGGRD